MSNRKLLDRVRREIRRRNYSYSTEKTYCQWVVRYVRFNNLTHPRELGNHHIVRYLNYLANECNLTASTQNQALSALIFLYEHVLNIPVGDLKNLKRAKKPKRLPVVLSKEQALTIINELEGVNKLVMELIYGAGLRISEALSLRIQDVDLDYKQITVWNGKGQKDRITMLPDRVIPKLKIHLQKVRRLHQTDLKRGLGKTVLPNALSKKYPGAEGKFIWQYLFPSKTRRRDPRTGTKHRYHISARNLRRELNRVVYKLDVPKRATPHTFRHSFATHPVRNSTIMEFYYIYVLESIKDMNWYTGYTNNLKKRLKEHNSGRNKSTKHRRPFRLIYFEGCLNEEDAKAKEKYLKSKMGKRYIRNRLKRYFDSSNF